MKTSSFTYGFFIAFLATTFFLQWWQIPAYPITVWLFLALLVLSSFLLFLFTKRKTIALLIPITLGLALAFLSVARTTHVTEQGSIESFAHGQRVTLHGYIVAEPDDRPLKTNYTVSVDSIEVDGKKSGAKGLVLTGDSSGWPEHNYGDEILVFGKLEKPGSIGEFDYDRYLSIRSVTTIIRFATIRTVSTLNDPGRKESTVRLYRPLLLLHALKGRFEDQINRIQPEPQASFLAGLLTGSRRGIPDHVLADFKKAGITHIIAISGYNITVIIAMLSGLLFFVPLKWRFVPLVAGIIAFTLFVGASASVVRAAIMGILGLIALQAERKTDTRLLILAAATLMLLYNPKYLWYDTGFQLSFLAVIGIHELSPRLKKPLSWIPETLGLRTSLIATLAAQIATMPLTIFSFGMFSLVAPFTNVLIAPLVPLAMLFGFAGTVISRLWFPLGQVISYAAWGCMEVIILIAQWFGSTPFAAIIIS